MVRSFASGIAPTCRGIGIAWGRESRDLSRRPQPAAMSVFFLTLQSVPTGRSWPVAPSRLQPAAVTWNDRSPKGSGNLLIEVPQYRAMPTDAPRHRYRLRFVARDPSPSFAPAQSRRIELSEAVSKFNFPESCWITDEHRCVIAIDGLLSVAGDHCLAGARHFGCC